jgi:hypothetical protein
VRLFGIRDLMRANRRPCVQHPGSRSTARGEECGREHVRGLVPTEPLTIFLHASSEPKEVDQDLRLWPAQNIQIWMASVLIRLQPTSAHWADRARVRISRRSRSVTCTPVLGPEPSWYTAPQHRECRREIPARPYDVPYLPGVAACAHDERRATLMPGLSADLRRGGRDCPLHLVVA